MTSESQYINWHKNKNKDQSISTACEGYGVVLRLMETQSSIIKELQDFMASEDFVATIGRKFGIDPKECNYDAGIQKYLDGYEISPHPDIRRKALTYMVNINPSPTSEKDHYHTQYMALKKERAYVQTFWEGNDKVDRCWVPWDWCETKKTQTKNNSIVIFSPDNSTLHAVKANYNHLPHQRTQMYGNLWYLSYPGRKLQTWEDLDFKAHDYEPQVSTREKIKGLLPGSLVEMVRKVKKSVVKDNRGEREY